MADTIQMGGQLCSVVYVDASLAVPGDGSTPALAVKNVPAIASLASNTVYLCRRRANNAITLTDGTLATGNYVFFIGMPLSTDWLYDRMPAAAIAAWDADADTHALAYFAGSQTRFRLNPIDNAGFHRIRFERPTDNYGYCSYNNDVFTLDVRATYPGSEYCTNGKYFFTNNWWADKGVFLSNPLWITNSPEQSGAMCFMYARSVQFCDNHIEYSGRANNNPVWNYCNTVVFNYIRDLVINDNDFWIASFGTNGNNFYMLHVPNSYQSQTSTEFCRNNCYLVCQNYTYVSFFSLFCLYGKNIYSHDCKIEIARYYNRAGITGGSYLGVGYNYYTGANTYTGHGKWDLQNLSIDMGDVCNVAQMVYFNYYARDNSARNCPYFSSVIKNITAKCAPNSALANGLNTAIASSYGGTAFYAYLPPEFSPVENITAWHYMAAGLFVAGSENNTGDVNWNGPIYKSVNVKGTIQVHQTPFIQITNWTLGSAPANDKIYVNWSEVYVQSATIDPGNAWVAQQWLRWQGSWAQRFICDSIDVPVYINWVTTTGNDDQILINNVDGVAGRWYGTSYYYTGLTSTTYRTDGAASAIKLTGTISDTHFTQLDIALLPYRGLEWVPGAAGKATVTMHVAHKLMTNPSYLSKRLKMLVVVPYWDATIGEYQPKTVLGDVQGQWLDDSASTWNNDNGLTQLKLVVPFTVTAAGQTVTARLFYDWYDATGYCYIDPLIEFALL